MSLELLEGLSHFEHEFTNAVNCIVIFNAECLENREMCVEFPWILLQLDRVIDQAHHEVLVLL